MNTLYDDILVPKYGTRAKIILIYTLVIRSYILKMIGEFIKSEDEVFLKEPSDRPLMHFNSNDNNIFSKIIPKMIIVHNGFNIDILNNYGADSQNSKDLSLEALDITNLSIDSWDKYLDKIYYNFNTSNEYKVKKIIIEDIISVLTTWKDTSNKKQKEMIKSYNMNFDIAYNHSTFYQEPLYLISKNYWEKFSFSMSINDYDIYYNTELLETIENRYFDNGYFDEIIININYLYWYDDFNKLVNWSETKLKSALVSYRLNTIYSEDINRYYNTLEAKKFSDFQRTNTAEESLNMYKNRLPILLSALLKNKQSFGFELIGGYFGNEINSNNLTITTDEINSEMYELLCESLKNLSEIKNEAVAKIKINDNELFVCRRLQ